MDQNLEEKSNKMLKLHQGWLSIEFNGKVKDQECHQLALNLNSNKRQPQSKIAKKI